MARVRHFGVCLIASLLGFVSACGNVVRIEKNSNCTPGPLRNAGLNLAVNDGEVYRPWKLPAFLVEQPAAPLRVCMGFIGFTEAERQALAPGLQSLTLEALKKWTDALANHPTWAPRQVSVESMLGFCPGADPSLAKCVAPDGQIRFSFWKSAETFKAQACGRMAGEICVSNAAPCRSTVQVGPWHYGEEKSYSDVEYFRKVLVHEIGHIFGIADSYQIPGYLEFSQTMPPAVMNDVFAVNGMLTNDDEVAILAAWEFFKIRKGSCDTFGAPVPVRVQNMESAFACQPHPVTKVKEILQAKYAPAVVATPAPTPVATVKPTAVPTPVATVKPTAVPMAESSGASGTDPLPAGTSSGPASVPTSADSKAQEGRGGANSVPDDVIEITLPKDESGKSSCPPRP